MADVETTQVVTETVEVTETKTITTVDGTVTETTTTVKTIESGDAHGQEEVKAVEGDQVDVKVNGDADVAKDGDAVKEAPAEETKETAAEDEAADKVEVQEEKKEEGPPKVVLHQYPPGTSVPSLSGFCLKLETYLRMNKVPYENVHSYKVGKKGKMPWIEYKGDRIPDSNFIIEYLNKTFEIDMDKNLSKSERAQARALRIMLEENFMFTLLYSRWVDECNEFKKIIPAHQKGIGFTVTLKMQQRKARSTLDHQGIGRHSKEEIYRIAEQDLRALSDYLGEKPYFMGAEVTSLDASAFGILGNILLCGFEGYHYKLIKEELKNLADYVERLKSEFWPDWNEMVLGDKPEHTHIRRRFSFKTGKKKAKEPKKDDNSSEEGKGEKAEEGEAEAAQGDAKNEGGESQAKTEETKTEGEAEEKSEEKTEETTKVNGEASEGEKAEAEAKSD